MAGPTTKKAFADLGHDITSPTPFTTPNTPAGALYYRFVAAINLCTSDANYDHRGFKSANILLNGQGPNARAINGLPMKTQLNSKNSGSAIVVVLSIPVTVAIIVAISMEYTATIRRYVDSRSQTLRSAVAISETARRKALFPYWRGIPAQITNILSNKRVCLSDHSSSDTGAVSKCSWLYRPMAAADLSQFTSADHF